MKCYTVDGKGLDGLRLGECDDPGPPGPGEALVEVRAVALNFRDLVVAGGRYGGPMEKPIIACSDMAGVVLKTGLGVEGFAPGDKVVNAPFRCWPAGMLLPEWAKTFTGGPGVDGVLAERIVYPAASLVRVPAHLSFAEGSTLTIAGLTAWAAVVTHGETRPGEWVLTHGTGGVSVFAAQIAKMLGARVIMSTSSDEKAKTIRERVAVDEFIDYRDSAWPERVRQITGEGADVVVEVAGGESFGRSLKACAIGARLCLVGVLDGPQCPVLLPDIFRRRITVHGIFMESAEELRAFARAVETAGLRPLVDRVFPFVAAREAFDYLAAQKHTGKVVVQVGARD